MADYFVDDSVGGGNDDGTDWDTNAYNTGGNSGINTALAFAGYTAGDKIWVRRTSDYDEGVNNRGADIAVGDDGTPAAPLEFIGWPRPAILNTTITEGDWTNGSSVVDNVVGITITRGAHQGRYVTAPDGFQYLITSILYEGTVDGMAGGAEFTLGSALTNVTLTKKGRVYGFTDNLDTTGTLQFTADIDAGNWLDNNNLTDADGGDAELDVNAAAVGFIIDREYAGSTVSGVDGKFQIEADEDYATRPDVGGLRAAWDADAIDLVQIDFDGEDWKVSLSADTNWVFRNIEFRDSTDPTGMLNASTSETILLVGCMFKQNIDEPCVYVSNSALVIKRFTAEGNGTGSGQVFIFQAAGGALRLIDGAAYNMGDNCMSIAGGISRLTNVNLGIETENGDNEIAHSHAAHILGIDVNLGGTNGFVGYVIRPTNSVRWSMEFSIENYQKILGEHRTFSLGGIFDKVVVTDVNPNKKLSDDILRITPSPQFDYLYEEGQIIPFQNEFELASGANTIKYWLYNDTGEEINSASATEDIYLVAEYVDSYDDTTEYTITKAYSTEATIADAADADDWDSLSVSMTLATASKVRVSLMLSYYKAAGDIFIDPQAVLS